MNTGLDIKISEDAKLNFNKNFIPQSYYNETVYCDNLIGHVNAINAKTGNKITVEDFIARVINLINIFFYF